MSDEIKQIAALIGHQQAQETRVNALIHTLQSEAEMLRRQNEQLTQVIRGIDTASGNMTETIRKSVSNALLQVKKDVREAGLEQQKPAADALNQVAVTAGESVAAMRREMSRYTWKSGIYIALTILTVIGACGVSLTWFIDRGYDRIAAMQQMESEWMRKAPLATIRTCEGKPCIQVTGDAYTTKQGERFYRIQEPAR